MKLTKTIFSALGVAAIIMSVAGTAQADDGKKVYNKCKACHALEAGKHKVGPSLAGVVGRKAGTADGYKRYKGLKGADWTWDDASLDAYLSNPTEFTKEKTGQRSSMGFKLKKAEDRKAVIEYLKTK